jgi:3'-5' exoribonuclease
LNTDVVLAGAILHEIGRAVELRPSPEFFDWTETTIEGRLAGHSILGRDLVRQAGALFPELHPHLLKLLEHVVLAHLALPEWGSPRLPAVPEVLIVHHADDLDAKMEMFQRCLRNDPSSRDFTERDPILGRQLWKSREV